jgi:hypothetical protein
MRIVHLSLGIVFIIMLLVSGCVSDVRSGAEESQEAGDDVLKEQDVVQEEPEAVEEAPGESAPEGLEASVRDIVTEKGLYHSAELMRFNATVESNMYLSEAMVKASGISGKMNIERTVDIEEGENIMEFETTLPSCNTCSGIRPGNHTISVQLYYGELIAEASTTVEIQQ